MKGSRVMLLALFFLGCENNKQQVEMPEYNDGLAQKIRAAASAIPGELPVAINYTKYAASIRTWKDIIEDGGNDACTMARTVFQVEYPQGFVMIDAGMDRQVHHFFEKDSPQPFDDTAAAIVSQAVQQAKLVLITHEHGDHVAGAVRISDANIPYKTILTKEQANTLINNPQMPEIKLDKEKSRQYLIAEFESILPVAPGMVLIKAPGHTDGEIMIYARLQNGREFIFTGDVSWSFRGIADKKQKPKSEIKRVGENGENVAKQLVWLNDRLVKDKMNILVSHDDVMLPQYAAQGLIGNRLKITK